MAKKNQHTDFESLYTELEATIDKLEQGNLSLDEALALYERGMELAKQCAALLDSAEIRIQKLAPNADAMDSAAVFDGDLDAELLDDEDDE